MTEPCSLRLRRPYPYTQEIARSNLAYFSTPDARTQRHADILLMAENEPSNHRRISRTGYRDHPPISRQCLLLDCSKSVKLGLHWLLEEFHYQDE